MRHQRTSHGSDAGFSAARLWTLPALVMWLTLGWAGSGSAMWILDSHWKLDETDTESAVVTEELGTVHGTRLGNVTIDHPGVDGRAYRFPQETASYVDLGRTDVLPNTDPFRLDVWVNHPSGTQTSIQYILTNMLSGSSGRTILYTAGGRIILSNAGTNLLETTDVDIRDGEWHLLSVTREIADAENDILTLYVDSEEKASNTIANTRVFETTRTWQLGGTSYVSGRGFNGDIDDVQVFIIPEPSSAALLLGAAGLLWFRRRIS